MVELYVSFSFTLRELNNSLNNDNKAFYTIYSAHVQLQQKSDKQSINPTT